MFTFARAFSDLETMGGMFEDEDMLNATQTVASQMAASLELISRNMFDDAGRCAPFQGHRPSLQSRIQDQFDPCQPEWHLPPCKYISKL